MKSPLRYAALAAVLCVAGAHVVRAADTDPGTEYKIVHPDGSVEFTDQPAKGAEPIRIPKTQTFSLPRLQPAPASPPPHSPPRPPADTYTALTITSPADQSTVRGTGGQLTVSVNVQPTLRKGDTVVIYYDGQKAAAGGGSRFTVDNVYRGTHTLKAAVEGPEGGTELTSPTITIYVHQHSKLFKPLKKPQNP